MASYCTIQKKGLEGATRIDPQYYQPNFSLNRAKIRSLPCQIETLGNITSKFAKGIFDIRAEVYTKEGIPFVRISNLKDGLISDHDIAYIPPEVHKKETKTSLKHGDIILSKTAYPAASLVNLPECNVSQDTIAIQISRRWSNKIKSGYVVGYLNSTCGTLLMEQWFQGNIQMHLALPDAKRIPIPIFSIAFQNMIESMFWEADSLFANSRSLFDKAEKSLLSELGLADWNPVHISSYVKTFTEVTEAKRIDAEYFQPKYEQMMQKIRSAAESIDTLDAITDFTKGIEVGSDLYLDKGVPFVRVSDMSKFEISYGAETKYISDSVYEQLNLQFTPRLGEILITKDATPGIAFVVREERKQIISSGILRAKLKRKIDPDYLTLLINSTIIKSQIERDASGSVIEHWRPERVKATVVPLVSDKLQWDLGKKIREALAMRHKAKMIIQNIKEKIDAQIEK